MSKVNTNKLYEPFTVFPPCVCPECFQSTMAYKETDNVYARLDEDGIAGDFVVNTQKIFTCLNCGFTTDKYIATDKGWRFNPHHDDDYILEKNKISGRNGFVKDNPFVIPEGEISND